MSSTGSEMNTAFHEDLSPREFGTALLARDELMAWCEKKRLHLAIPDVLNGAAFIQTELLLVGVGESAVARMTDEQASGIVAGDGKLRAYFVGRGVSVATKQRLTEILRRYDAGEAGIVLGAKEAIRGSAMKQWRALLAEAIDNGELVLRDFSSKLPITEWIDVSDDSRSPVVKSADWTEKARQIADEFFDNDTKNNCRDSLNGYALRVMEEMQKRGIHGPRGRFDNHNTIKKEALQGAKWWQLKKR